MVSKDSICSHKLNFPPGVKFFIYNKDIICLEPVLGAGLSLPRCAVNDDQFHELGKTERAETLVGHDWLPVGFVS